MSSKDVKHLTTNIDISVLLVTNNTEMSILVVKCYIWKDMAEKKEIKTSGVISYKTRATLTKYGIPFSE